MKKTTKTLIAVIIMLLVLTTAHLTVSSAKEAKKTKVDITKLTQETQKASQNPDKMQFIWWIPTVFWSEVMTNDPTVSKADADKFIKALDEYIMVAVVDGKIGDYGNVIYSSESKIRGNISVLDSKGNKYTPLTSDKINSDARELLAIFKPILSNMLGNLGQNLNFYMFPKNDKDGNTIVDPAKNGSFTIVYSGDKHRWKLPLLSLFPDVACPKCKEECSGAYNYCPWCGTKLEK